MLHGVETLTALVRGMKSLDLLVPICNETAEVFELGDLAAILALDLLSLGLEAVSALISPFDLGGPDILPLSVLLASQGGSSCDGVTEGERGTPLL